MFINGDDAFFYVFKSMIVLFIWFMLQFFYKATLFCDDRYDYLYSKGKNKLIYGFCWLVFMPFYAWRAAVLVLSLDVMFFALSISLKIGHV